MAGVGPAPKSERSRGRDTAKRDRVSADGTLRGMELPDALDALGPGEAWHPMTVEWWDAWRASPQAVRMLTDVDWYFLLDTALMHNSMWAKGRWDFAAEVRLRVAKFGATPEDRLRIKLEVEVPEDFPVGSSGNDTNVTVLANRRNRWADE